MSEGGGLIDSSLSFSGDSEGKDEGGEEGRKGGEERRGREGREGERSWLSSRQTRQDKTKTPLYFRTLHCIADHRPAILPSCNSSSRHVLRRRGDGYWKLQTGNWAAPPRTNARQLSTSYRRSWSYNNRTASRSSFNGRGIMGC
jgi:hypothetical protein